MAPLFRYLLFMTLLAAASAAKKMPECPPPYTPQEIVRAPPAPRLTDVSAAHRSSRDSPLLLMTVVRGRPCGMRVCAPRGSVCMSCSDEVQARRPEKPQHCARPSLLK